MQAISRVEGSISCFPNNMEKYISFSLGQLRFIDSLQFLNASLDSLVSANQPEYFLITNQYEPDEEKRSLLLRKGVYPISIWTVGSAFRKRVFHHKRPSTVRSLEREYRRKTTTTHRRSGAHSTAVRWGTTTTCISEPMCFSWPMSSKHSARPASTSMGLIQPTTIQVQD